MAGLDENMMRAVRRNKLLGLWAAEKLGLAGDSAEAYSTDLAMGTLDFARSDVVGKIRKDFDAAGVNRSDEEIRRVMNECWLSASGRSGSTGRDASSAAAMQIARNLIPK